MATLTIIHKNGVEHVTGDGWRAELDGTLSVYRVRDAGSRDQTNLPVAIFAPGEWIGAKIADRNS